MKIRELTTPDNIEKIECKDCGAWTATPTQEDIDLLKELGCCLMCNAPEDQLIIW